MIKSLYTYHPDFMLLKYIVAGVICLFLLVGIIFFCMLLFLRLKRIWEAKKKEVYTLRIHRLLNEYLFNNKEVSDVMNRTAYKKYIKSSLFKRVFIKCIKGLHHNYSGEYSKKLEHFLVESGLVNFLLKKLDSRKWYVKIEAIRDLSSLNYQPALEKIESLKTGKNPLVAEEIMLAVIKLKGIEEAIKYMDSNIFLNDWLQSNIIFVVKKNNIPPPDNLRQLLHSKNRSIVILAVRLINYYKQASLYHTLSEFYQQSSDIPLRREIAAALKKTEHLH